MIRRVMALLIVSALTGCATAPHYACGLPAGVTCKPVSAVYQSSVTGSFTHAPMKDADTGDSHGDAKVGTAVSPPAVVATVKPGDPLITPPKLIRVWVNRWQDHDGDLHDETYLYLRLDNGHWTLPQ